MRKIDLTKSPESHCPRFENCNINKCPLHKNYADLKNDSSDPSKLRKEKCTSKKIRLEIGKAFGLKFSGLTSREWNGHRLLGKNDFNSNLHGENEKKCEINEFEEGCANVI